MLLLNTAMLGAWHVHAPDYAAQIKAHPETAISVVWDSDEERGRQFAEGLGVPFEKNLDTILTDKKIDGVVVNTPTNMHREVITASALARKHIFTEKVLAITSREAHEIAEVVKQSGVKFVISFPHRALPHNLFAKEVVDKGLLGDISLLRIRNAHAGTVLGWLPQHFYNQKECGGGAMIGLGAHGMYLAAWLLGEPHRISAMFSHITGKEVEDNAVAVIEFKNKAMAINETSFLSDRSPFSLELYGTKGSLLIGGPNHSVQINSSLLKGEIEGWVQPSSLPKALPSPLEQWIGSILRDEPIHFTIDDAVILTTLMDGAYRSHKTRCQVTFPLD